MESSSILDDNKLTKNTIEKLIHEIFSRDRSINEKKVEEFAEGEEIRKTS